MTAPAIETIMLTAPVIPVIVINDVADAVPMAEALADQPPGIYASQAE